jgi:hypothetical protein
MVRLFTSIRSHLTCCAGAANRGPNVPLFRDAGDNAIDTTANAGDVGDGSVGGVDVEVKGTDSAQDVQGEQTGK